MTLAGPEFFNMDSSPRRAPQKRSAEERNTPSPSGKTLRPRSPTASLDTDVASDIANDESGMLDGLDAEDRRILSSVILGVDITEVFSPDRVTLVARKFGLVPGSSFDLTDGWDFDIEEHRQLAWKKIKSECPNLLIGSPPCTMFSLLQELNIAVHGHKPEWRAKFEKAKAKAIRHIEFCCELYTYQLNAGRHFLHEHPWTARSWKLPCVEK